jgi:rhomboid domain-containing protein 1
MQRNRRSRETAPLVLALGVQMANILQGQEVPPITVFLIIINVMIHISPYPHIFGFDLSNIGANCIYPTKIVDSISHGQLLANRVILSGFIHADDIHLYYNMISLLWKGIHLENRMTSSSYLKLVVYSLLCSHCLLVVMSYALDTMGVPPQLSGYHSCAVGFSAVIFCLKYVWNVQSPGTTGVGGMQVPTRYAAWLELVLTSLMVPNASFLGHLAGILAGVIYIQGLRGKAFMR